MLQFGGTAISQTLPTFPTADLYQTTMYICILHRYPNNHHITFRTNCCHFAGGILKCLVCCHFADEIFKCNFMNKDTCILIENQCTFDTRGPIGNKSSLVEVTVVTWTTDDPRWPTHINILHDWHDIVQSIYKFHINSVDTTVIIYTVNMMFIVNQSLIHELITARMSCCQREVQGDHCCVLNYCFTLC